MLTGLLGDVDWKALYIRGDRVEWEYMLQGFCCIWYWVFAILIRCLDLLHFIPDISIIMVIVPAPFLCPIVLLLPPLYYHIVTHPNVAPSLSLTIQFPIPFRSLYDLSTVLHTPYVFPQCRPFRNRRCRVYLRVFPANFR